MKLESKRPKEETVYICFFLLGCIVYGIVSVTLVKGIIPFAVIIGVFFILGKKYYKHFEKKFRKEESAVVEIPKVEPVENRTVERNIPVRVEEPVETTRTANEIVKSSSDYQWAMLKQGKEYYFTHTVGNTVDYVKTPSGIQVHTSYPQLADRILSDLEKYGYNYRSADTILSWHFTLLDNFSSMSHKELEQLMDQSFLQKNDWTFAFNQANKEWTTRFGQEYERKAAIRRWLSKCTPMQITAACCIGNAYHSLNIAFVIAQIMEFKEGASRRESFYELSNLIANNSAYGPQSVIMGDFWTFNLYYGIHLEEKGKIIFGNSGSGQAVQAKTSDDSIRICRRE